MRLLRVRDCDGACCRESPRWPDGNGDCVFHDRNGCRLMRGEAEIPETQNALPHLTGPDCFILTCKLWPHNTPNRIGKTGGCCWQWLA